MKAGFCNVMPRVILFLRVHSSRDGLSLVEILVAMLVLAVLAIAGGAFVSRGQIDVGTQLTKRAAIEAANNRLEEVIWANPSMASVAGTTSTNVALNGISGFAMTTTRASLGASWNNCYKITVGVEYVKGGSSVQLETLRYK